MNLLLRGRRIRMPDFAGVALVDILANGVGMLIIVIVLSVTARLERDQRFAEQAAEVAAVMSHRFSTSLVLNSLAASPPARLHDYEHSPLDQDLTPEALPILELHAGFVREYYTGTVWTRSDLLAPDNTMQGWLASFTELQKLRLRIDLYDVDQFYVVMSILREYGIRSRHWHFVPTRISLAEARRCPPGTPAKDCALGEIADATGRKAPPPPTGAGSSEDEEATAQGSDSGDDWPPAEVAALGEGRGGGNGEDARNPLPGGVAPGPSGQGGTRGGEEENAEQQGEGQGDGEEQQQEGGQGTANEQLGSFPNERSGRGGSEEPQRGLGERAQSESPGGRQMRFRIALPESARQEAEGSAPPMSGSPTLGQVFGAIIYLLRQFQDELDAGGTPAPYIANFTILFQQLLGAELEDLGLDDEEMRIVGRLAQDFTLMYRLGGPAPRLDPLALHPFPPEPESMIVVEANNLLHGVGVVRAGAVEPPDADNGADEDEDGGAAGGNTGSRPILPDLARVTFHLNAWPDIWQGIDLTLEPDSVLVMPSIEYAEPYRFRWRAVAYINPTLDDFVVGFVFAGTDAQERLRILGDDNRVRFSGRPLLTPRPTSWFGARGWLVSLYAALAAGLILLVLSRRLSRPAARAS